MQRPAIILLSCQLALGGLIAAASGGLIVHLNRNALTDATHDLAAEAFILAEMAERTFEGVDLVQMAVLERLLADGIDTPEMFRAEASSLDMHATLVNRARALPQIDALTLIDAKGRLLNFSRAWPVPEVSVSDRDYFTALKADSTLFRFMSQPVVNRGTGTGTWTIYLARKVNSPDGEFVGIILAAMRMNYFEEFYGRIASGSQQAISIFRTDNILLARYPPLYIGRDAGPGLAFTQRAQDNAGPLVVRKISQIDGAERLIATRTLNKFPVVVNVSDTISAILDDWKKQAWAIVTGACSIIGLSVVIGVMVARQARNQRALAKARQANSEADAALELAEEQHRAEREISVKNIRIAYLAHHDPLTGLPNRSLFLESLSKTVARSKRGEPGALMYLDLDHFKAVNDTLGHSAGDNLLRQVAARIGAEIRETDTAARLGGDEFAVIECGADQPADASALAARLVVSLCAPYEIDEQQVVIGASIGIALIPADGEDPDELMRAADMALYGAKADGRGRYRFFVAEMDAVMQARRTLEADLRRALSDGQFEVYYQPLMNVKTRVVIGFEALVRWNHPTKGLLFPDSFIPLAEEIGLIVPLGNWVLCQSCRDAMTWQGEAKVAVNISVIQFHNKHLVEDVMAALAGTGLPANRLELEITETVMLDDTDAILLILHRLRALGIGIAMDDFGTGYSSLSYLRRFPFSKVKIDRSFITGMALGNNASAIVNAVTDLCDSLGMTTLAEGVETEEQLQQLRLGNCAEAQGYLFSKARPAFEIAAMLAAIKLDAETVEAEPMSETLSELIYCSRATPSVSDPMDIRVAKIVAVGRLNNQRRQITGGLLYSGGYFVQIVQGPTSELVKLFGRISTDRRHTDILLLSSREIDERTLHDWGIGVLATGEEDEMATMLLSHAVSTRDISTAPAIRDLLMHCVAE